MIGFIGGGNMAEAMIKGMLSGGLKDIYVSEPTEERRKYLQEIYPVKITGDNRAVVTSCAIIIIAVKPQTIPVVLDEINDKIEGNKTVVSIAAGIKLSYLKSKLNTYNIIRVMPNTPALVLQGMSVLSVYEGFSSKDLDTVKTIFSSIGKVIVLPEKYMDIVTAVSGSGPAFISYCINAIIKAGIKMGLDSEISSALTIQTLSGTAKLLSSGMRPSDLIKMVASPGGTTEAGLKVLNENNIDDKILHTVEAAKIRSEELGKQ